MSYHISVFADLIKKYKTYNDLEKWLNCDDKINHINIKKYKIHDCGEYENSINSCKEYKEKDIAILSLDRSNNYNSIPDFDILKYFRSVVWDITNNVPLCVSPIKSNYSFDFSENNLQQLISENYIIQEHLDGFMINCVYHAASDKISIFSRSTMGATGTIDMLKSVTLRSLFEEALYQDIEGQCNLIDEETYNNKIKERIKHEMDVENGYTFCTFNVQHPNYRIVSVINKPSAILIQKGRLNENNNVEIYDCTLDRPAINLSQFLKSINCSDEINNLNIKKLVEMGENTLGLSFKGLIIKKECGTSNWKINTSKYEEVKALKGNDKDLLSKYARLKYSNLLSSYLHYYPEDYFPFKIYNGFFNFIIEKLQYLYLSVHIFKNVSIQNVEKLYWPHLYRLHEKYITILRKEGNIVNEDIVQDYLSKIHYKSLLALLRDHLRLVSCA